MAKYFAFFIPACANVMEEQVMLQLNGDQAKLEMGEQGRAEYLDSLKERIMSLAQTKVSPDAMPYLDTIKTTLTGSILPTIVNEKIQHVASHTTLFNAFATANATYAADIESFSEVKWRATDTGPSDHLRCRNTESGIFLDGVVCAGEQATAQNTFDGHDFTVKRASGFAGVCSAPDAWRTSDVEGLNAYSGALTDVIGSRIDLDAKITECEGIQAELGTRRRVCNNNQNYVEDKSCELAVGYQTAWQVYDGLYLQAKTAFESEFSLWEEQSGDRLFQCQLVGTLVCYITALEDHDDAAPLQSAIADCDREACDVDVVFTHEATPAAVDMIPIPQVPCTPDFQYIDFPEGTSAGECSPCPGIL